MTRQEFIEQFKNKVNEDINKIESVFASGSLDILGCCSCDYCPLSAECDQVDLVKFIDKNICKYVLEKYIEE